MASSYFFDEGTITLNVDTTDVAPIGLQGLTITPSFEHQELFTADSTFREDVKRHSHEVSVEIDHSKWPLELAQAWLAGDETATATASQDTSDVALFSVTAVSTSTDGTVERTVEVTDIHFSEIIFVDGSQGEYEEYTLSGTGKTVGQLEDTSGA